MAGAFDAAEHELLKGQVEFASKPATDPAPALASLQEARRTLAKIAKAHGLSLFAAGSHPLGSFERQETTEKERYRKLEDQFGIITHRSMCCAMHVHVEVPDALDRMGLIEMIQIAESVTSIDLTDLRCPYLARRVRKALLRASVGECLEFVCADPLAAVDIPHLVATLGHELVAKTESHRRISFAAPRDRQRPSRRGPKRRSMSR